jgi:hypothetical protein
MILQFKNLFFFLKTSLWAGGLVVAMQIFVNSCCVDGDTRTINFFEKVIADSIFSLLYVTE